MRCNGMGSYEFLIRPGWLRCHVVWFEVVAWGDLEDDLVIRTTLYYTVLLQFYSVLQSTTPYYKTSTPVLLCTTKYYSSTALYYKVLLQYYSVLQWTTPYYKVLLQYYSALQSITPVLLCTTMDYSVLQSTTPVLLSTT